jgi:hypothetical protein
VRRSRCTAAYNLFTYRKIYADHSILKEADLLIAEKMGDNARDGGVEK